MVDSYDRLVDAFMCDHKMWLGNYVHDFADKVKIDFDQLAK